MKKKIKQPAPESNPRRVPELKQGKYSDGHPLDEVQYLECKLILKGDRFTAESNFDDFAKIVKRAAASSDVDFSRKPFKDARPKIREVIFVDTKDFQLYNHAFILRRRVNYENGFAVSDPENRFQIPPSGHAKGRRDGCAPAHLRGPQDQVQIRGVAAQGSGRRLPFAVFAHRRVSAQRRA
jgi:hypothetical protein